MRNELQCEIVQDLLPSYVDGLTSEVTNAAVCEHLEGCGECRQILQRMQEPQKMEIDTIQKEEIDFLKKTRNRLRRKICISIIMAAVFVAAVLFIRFYCVGSELYAESVMCRAEVSGRKLTVNATVINSSLGISKPDFKEDNGVVTLSYKATLVSPFHKGTLKSSYEAERDITQVRVGERIIWDHGVNIQANVSEIYLAKHAYIGDISSNGQSSRALGMGAVLGNFKSELQTSREPYGWKFLLENAVLEENQSDMEQQMKSYAYVLLATIENLGYVTYDYLVENEEKSLTVTLEEAGRFAGQDIKECGGTAAALQSLIEKTRLKEYGIFSAQIPGEEIRFNIIQNTEEEIYVIDVSYYLDGTPCGGGGSQNADGSAIRRGEVMDFRFTPKEFGYNLKDKSKIKIEVQMEGRDGKTYKVSSPIQMGANYGYSYDYVLSGNAREGFELMQ